MKIEIDLNDILGDEYGSETLQESVRRQVIDNLTKTLEIGVGKKIDTEINALINEEIKTAITAKMPEIFDDLLNAEYNVVDRYGDRQKEKTTIRKELVKIISEQMVYSKKSYDSDKNVFTRAVDKCLEEHLSAFRSEFNRQIDTQFVAEAMAFATKKMQERLGVK